MCRSFLSAEPKIKTNDVTMWIHKFIIEKTGQDQEGLLDLRQSNMIKCSDINYMTTKLSCPFHKKLRIKSERVFSCLRTSVYCTFLKQ